MTRKPYPSDLSHKEWELLKPLLPQELPISNRREVKVPEVVEALMYVADGIK